MSEGVKCYGKVKKLNRVSGIGSREGEGRSAILNGVVRRGGLSAHPGRRTPFPGRCVLDTSTVQRQAAAAAHPRAALLVSVRAVYFNFQGPPSLMKWLLVSHSKDEETKIYRGVSFPPRSQREEVTAPGFKISW